MWDYLSTNETKKVPSEAILNVLRRSEDPVLGTNEIAEEIGMSRQGAENRLKELAGDDRVKSKKIGTTWVWGLHPDERQDPVPPEIDRLVKKLDWAKERTRGGRLFAEALTIVALVTIYLSYSGALFSTPTPVYSNATWAAAGWVAAGSGAVTWLLIGSVRWGSMVAEKFARWRVAHRRMNENEETTTEARNTRGQVRPELLLVAFVLLLVAGALVRFAVELFEGLATTSAFSPLFALLLTVLIVGALLASLFEGAL